MQITLKRKPEKWVAIWIMAGVGMLVVQILLGGITRLTGSGLSITEWDIITGFLPPLNQNQWIDEFHKYQQTSQFHFLNSHFTLDQFKSIFFWEWLHRLWGRLIGFAFIVPFLIFIIQNRIKKQMVRPLLILFLLGALQGGVGWIMVLSGLTGDAVYVKPAKLALHFVLACLLISYALWFGLQLIIKQESRIMHKGLKGFLFGLISILFLQLLFGALLAGNKAATVAPTWPDINGSFIPSLGSHEKQSIMNIPANPIAIQFVHRSIAYLLTVFTIIWTFMAIKIKPGYTLYRIIFLPVFLVLVQVSLGVFTVLTSIKIRPAKWNIFEWMAELHQLTAILLLLSFVIALFFVSGKQKANYGVTIDPQLI